MLNLINLHYAEDHHRVLIDVDRIISMESAQSGPDLIDATLIRVVAPDRILNFAVRESLDQIVSVLTSVALNLYIDAQ